MNDRFYNSPALWGPANGAGGDYGGKTDEQLLEDAAKIHAVVNYLDPEMYSELLRKHGGDDDAEGGKRADDKEQDEECDQPAKKAKTDSDGVSTMDLNVDACGAAGERFEANDAKLEKLTTESVDAPVNSPKKLDCNSEVKRIQSSPEYDPTCKDCVQPTRDPSTQELVMFLHALRYSGPDFDFSTPMPDWATENWNEEDEWKLY